MRPVSFMSPPPFDADTETKINWLMEAMTEIERASYEDPSEIADAMTIENHTATRSLDPTACTLNEVANVVATLISDTRNRGVNRGS